MDRSHRSRLCTCASFGGDAFPRIARFVAPAASANRICHSDHGIAFTAEHGSLIVAPYVFLFAIAAAWVRDKTGSRFNCVLMHAVNNVFLLLAGLRIHDA